MTKTATDARRCAVPAAGAAAALSAMLFASRLPATLDFILPRRAGWPLFVLGFEALSRPGVRSLFAAAATILLLGSLARFASLAAAAARGRKWSPKDFLVRGFHAALVLAMARWSFSIWLEVSQKVWFPFGSMNALEPAANFAVCALIAWGAMYAALARRSVAPWAAANALAAAAAFAAYGAWAAAPEAAAGRRLFVVLTQEEGKPGQAAYDLPVAPPLPPVSGVRRLESLRALYEARAKLMDPDGLRAALLLGAREGDDLARSLLLENLSSAPPSPGALETLGALADERANRVGPMGASRIALAYAHLGDAVRAEAWARRGAEGPRGIPAGLLDLSGGGALKPGRVAGRADGLKPERVALYRKTDPGAPYLLDAAALVASTEPDAKGRFSFSGLAAGRYYLAFAFPGTDEGGIRVSGHRGDIALDPRKSSVELPLLTFRPR